MEMKAGSLLGKAKILERVLEMGIVKRNVPAHPMVVSMMEGKGRKKIEKTSILG